MEFLSPNYRKRHGRLLFVSYIFSALVIGALVMFFALEVSGFYINRSGEILLNSIVFVDSHPASAEIYINGKLERSRTDARLVLPEGQHFVEIQKPGYDLWQKQVYLEGGAVTHIRYPFLYPTNPLSQLVDSYPQLATASQTPDRRWLMVQPRPNQLAFELLDLDQSDLPRRDLRFELPESELEHDLLVAKVLAWSHDNQHFLVRLNFDDDKIEYWIFSIDDDRPPIQVPQTRADDIPIRDVRLVDNRIREVHILYRDGQLFNQSLTDDQLEAELVAQNVVEFSSHGRELLVYVRSTAIEALAEVIINDDGTEYPLLELAHTTTGQYSLALSRFEGDWYYVIGSTTDSQLEVFQNPLEAIKQDWLPIPLTTASLSGLSSLAFSSNVRFVGATYDGGLYIYDLEAQRSYRYTVAGLPADYSIQWMDGHRLYGVIDDELNIWEFDSYHQVSMGSVRTTADVFFDKSYDSLYLLSNRDDDSDLKLTATDLVIKQ